MCSLFLTSTLQPYTAHVIYDGAFNGSLQEVDCNDLNIQILLFSTSDITLGKLHSRSRREILIENATLCAPKGVCMRVRMRIRVCTHRLWQ